VRIGNAAAKQLQLDIFGEVMDVFYQSTAKGLSSPEQSAWDLQCKLIEHLEPSGRSPMKTVGGRRPRRHFTHSKVMAWVPSTGRQERRSSSALKVRSSAAQLT
jgi:GH15 family glucan-1,4-alpha-glucosidase